MKDRANVLLVKPATGPDAGLWAIPASVVADGESVRNAAIRSVKDNLGLETDPKLTLFICERVVPDDHRVGVFVLSEPIVLPDEDIALSVNDTEYMEARWADVRSLGDIQHSEGMSEFTVDAFVKFSSFLKSQAPVSGRVN
jgi:ADP-ribose pyrophosphatase YjhB (NUDIX family)